MELDLVDIGIRLFVVILLIGLNGFFVAAEFALVSSRPTRIERMIEESSLLGRLVRRSMADPNRFISASQVGITMASLALGWVGEPALAALLEPLLESFLPHNVMVVSTHAISVIIAFSIITYLHLVLGEQVPKMMAIQRAEKTLMFTVQLTHLVGILLRPLIAIVYWSTEWILRPMGLRYESETHMVYTVEELEMLVEASGVSGQIEPVERELLRRAFSFAAVTTQQVMIPRTEMTAVPADTDCQDLLQTVLSTGRSRIPIYQDSLDQIVGIVHVKELLAKLSSNGDQPFTAGSIARPDIKVPESLPLDELLARLQTEREHMAIVIDEFGGTAGLVTLEDVLERLVGEIDDEFEAPSLEIVKNTDGSSQIAGLVPIEEFNKAFTTELESGGYETIGGLVFDRIGRKPEVGDAVFVDGFEFRVDNLDGLRIDRLSVRPRPQRDRYSVVKTGE